MKKKLLPALIVTGLIILVVIIMGITALINKYTPTKKTEDLKEYFNISSDDEAALIVDNDPFARGVAPQGRRERTLRLSEVFQAMAQFSPPPPAGGAPSQRGPRGEHTFFDSLSSLPAMQR